MIPPRPLHNLKGYTLIEILVVLFIISIVTSVALLTLGHNQNKELENFTNELTQLLSLAEEQAILQSTVLGVDFNAASFHFVRYGENNKENWLALNDAILKSHAIPDGISLTIHANGQAIAINGIPQIIFSTDGDSTPFQIDIGRKGEKPRYQIQGTVDGSVTHKTLT